MKERSVHQVRGEGKQEREVTESEGEHPQFVCTDKKERQSY